MRVREPRPGARGAGAVLFAVLGIVNPVESQPTPCMELRRAWWSIVFRRQVWGGIGVHVLAQGARRWEVMSLSCCLSYTAGGRCRQRGHGVGGEIVVVMGLEAGVEHRGKPSWAKFIRGKESMVTEVNLRTPALALLDSGIKGYTWNKNIR
jgi:hypothetical protein